ncbi:MAG TPA: phenylalanine--tRNA ligase subunit beta [Candidatus Acidoferrales bacterium]|nr:phenylalanine--tRNA ligase subunit beta [Candidatus Acidoferrales bacterium]
MRVPVSWLRDFVETQAKPEAFADALTQRGFAVDGIAPQPMPERIVVGRIETLTRHPNADRLQVASVDAGSEKLQIVTGATNVAVGDKVPIALPGSVVYARGASPAEGVQRETKRIEPSSLRGVQSNGMMCSPDELALPGDYEDGILLMEEDAQVGRTFWEVARFGDAVLDVDVPSNRPDGLSIFGLAREAAAGLRAPFTAPSLDIVAGSSPSPVAVVIEDPDVCRRLLGQTFAGLQHRRSPMWMVLRLAAAGMRSLNLLVDISNFVQIETGQPLHFYDLQKIRGGKIVARAARVGESVVTLDGVERKLPPGTPVIADGVGPVGIAGIMGGIDSGVSAQTRDLFIESPNFVGKRIRRAAIALGLRTEGALRHEKDLPLELPEVGRRRAAQLLSLASGAASTVVETGERPGPLRRVRARAARVNALLGSNFTVKQMKETLGLIGLEAQGDAELEVTVPYWRPDVVEEVDVIEEVARGIGYDAIPEVRAVAAAQSVDEGLYDQETFLARGFRALGYNEIVTIPLQGAKAIAAWERSGIPFWKELVSVTNPLSEDQRFLRPSLLPGVLSTASRWWSQSQGDVRLFEIGHVFRPLETHGAATTEPGKHSGAYVENGVIEWPSLCGVLVFARDDADATLDRHALETKGEIETVMRQLVSGDLETQLKERMYFHPGAAATLRVGGKPLAKFGRVHPKLARAYELPQTTYAFSLYLENLAQQKPVVNFKPLPRFPSTRRDIAVVVEASIEAGALMAAVRASGAPYFESVRAFDEYQGPQIGAGKKSVALAVVLRKADGTLTDAEANASKDAIVAALRTQFGASLRE